MQALGWGERCLCGLRAAVWPETLGATVNVIRGGASSGADSAVPPLYNRSERAAQRLNQRWNARLAVLALYLSAVQEPRVCSAQLLKAPNGPRQASEVYLRALRHVSSEIGKKLRV